MKRVIVFVLMILSAISYGQNYKFGKVSKAEVEEKSYLLDKDAVATYLLDKKDVYYNYDGSRGWTLVTEVHQRIKIYKKEGFKYATKIIPIYNRGGHKEFVTKIKGYTYWYENNEIKKKKLSKSNIFREKSSKNLGNVKIVFPLVKEGAIIDFRYKITSPFYDYIDDIIIQREIPIKRVNKSIRIPEYFIFNKKQKGYLSFGIKEAEKNISIEYSYRQKNLRDSHSTKKLGYVELSEKEYRILEKNIPALKDEPFVYNINNYKAALIFELGYTNFPNSYVKPVSSSWKSVAKNIYKSENFGGELNKKKYYKSDLDELLAKASSDTEKVGIIFNFVKSKIKWNGNVGKYVNKGVKKAYKEGVGNIAEINLILTSMLQSANINAYPVLVSTKGNGIPSFPTLKGFNYVITAVVFSNKSYLLLDASEKYSLPGVLPVRVLNWGGRLVTKEGDSYSIPLKNKKLAIEENRIIIKISEEGEAKGFMISKYRNHKALAYRKKYNHLKEDEIKFKIEEDYLIEINDFKIKNIEVSR